MYKKEKEEFMKQKRAAYKRLERLLVYYCGNGILLYSRIDDSVRPKESVLEKESYKVSANYCFRC
ncbi:MAG: hypothetical protein ACLRZ6_14425 [Lachnospiraceae bacterium]